MRIGIFSDRYLPQTDGVSFSIETFRIELEKLGHEVYIFAPRPSWRYKDPSPHIIRFAAVKGLFFDDWLTSFFFPPQAMRQIERLKLDIIHFQTPSQIGMLGAYYAIRSNLPLVTTYHTDLFEYVKHYPGTISGTVALSLLTPLITGGGMPEYRQAISSIKPERNVDKWNQKMVVRGLTMLHNRCDLVITPSKKIDQQLKSWKTSAPMAILPTGVDKITTTSSDIAIFKAKCGIDPGDKVISFVGRIGTEKNLGLLIKSFEIVAAKLPQAKLVIAGPGDDLEYYQDLANKTKYGNRIIFPGFIEHHKLGALYHSSDVFAFPSLADTQGITVNEAACAGVPIVMVDRNITEVVQDGENGYFSTNSARIFASKIITILAHPKLHSDMSERSKELSAKVTARKQAVKLLRLYEETIEHHHERNAKNG